MGDLNTLAGTRNVSVGTVRTYGTGTDVTVTGDQAARVPQGCTANFVFGQPFFFKRKPVFSFWVDFHYGQHLDAFHVVDRRGYGPHVEYCPPTSALLDMSVNARFHPSAISTPESMNETSVEVSVTAYVDKPYVNCYDSARCNVIQITAKDRRPSVGCCMDIPVVGKAAPYYWHVGEYDVRLNHFWELTHGYSSYLYADGIEDGYIGRNYNQTCRWVSGGFDPTAPTSCYGDG